MMKKRFLRNTNMVLSAILVALGFNSCDDPDGPSSADMYGPPSTIYRDQDANVDAVSADADIKSEEAVPVVKE